MKAHIGDEPCPIAMTTALILNHHSYEAIAFTEPQKALWAAEARFPDFLITDVSTRFKDL